MEHQQKINSFEKEKNDIINNHQANKDYLNNNINELVDKLSHQQKNAIKTELERNDEKTNKENELTEKIHQFSNIESDLSKQIDCNYADIEYLQSMNN